MTVSDLKKHFQEQISGQYTPSESELLFQIFCEKIFGFNKIQLRSSEQSSPHISAQAEFHNKLLQLQQGKPYQQIFGEAEFFGLKFFVNEHVLIPRPETEELLEMAISEITEKREKRKDPCFGKPSTHNQQPITILDIGTGSGIIPIVLKKHFSKAQISAMDISEKALETARKNAAYHQTDISFLHADYLNTELEGNYDIIISNPPYIGKDEEKEIADSVKEFEPKNALFSPTKDALIFYRKIAEDCKKHLSEDGMVFLEINQKLGPETLELFSGLSEARLLKDISGNNRFVVGRK